MFARRMGSARTVVGLAGVALFVAACGGAPVPADTPEGSSPVARRAADAPDDCAELPGRPAPKPLRTTYTGVAAKARCDREVYTIMGGLTHFLGVKCEYCHVKGDYIAPTHNKQVANWMAQELIPSLEKQKGGQIWCNDCHVVDGKATPKILRSPRDQAWAVEWMTTHLAERFGIKGGEPLRCKSCHLGNPGSPEFEKKIILTDHLPGRRGQSAPGGDSAGAKEGADAGP